MSKEIKEILVDEFKECRNSFMVSLNTVTILSVVIFVTTFMPYISLVGNLLDMRIEEHNRSDRPIRIPTKSSSQDKEKINQICDEIAQERLAAEQVQNKDQQDYSKYYRQCEQEMKANFDLVDLRNKWLESHSPSIDFSAESQIPTFIGDFSFKSGELTLVYPGIISLLMIYLFFHMYCLYDLQKELEDKGLLDKDIKILRIPISRTQLSWSLLYILFTLSVVSLNLSPCGFKKFPNIQECVIPHRSGQIITQETSFQIDRNFDLWISLPSIIIAISAPSIYFRLDKKRKKTCSKENQES